MNIIFLSIFFVIIAFASVIIFGAPYLPTLNSQIPVALEMLDLKRGQTMLELGSGDGRILVAAAERGILAIGFELNPILVFYSKIKTRKYKSQIKIIWGNYWKAKLPNADGIFVFLLQKYMTDLNKKIIQESQKPVKLVSFAFQIPNKKSISKTKGLYLYKYN